MTTRYEQRIEWVAEELRDTIDLKYPEDETPSEEAFELAQRIIDRLDAEDAYQGLNVS